MEPALTGRNWLCFVSRPKTSLSARAAHHGSICIQSWQAGSGTDARLPFLDYRLLPLPDGVALAICNTMVKHSIAKGEYNQRRAECEAGVRELSKCLPHVLALRT